MRRSLSAACILLLLAGAAQAEAPRAKLNASLSALQASKAKEATLKKELQQTARDLDTLRSRATELAGSLQQTESRASKAERELNQLNRELAVKETEFAARKQEYTHTLTSLLRMRQIPPTAMFADARDAQRWMRTAQAMKTTNRALAARAETLRRDTEHLNALRRNVSRSKEQVTHEEATLKEKRSQLQADLATRQRLQQKLQRDHETARTQVNKFSRESASLKELIGKLESAPKLSTRSAPTHSPAPSRGRLKLPVAGRVLHKFGERKNANETYRGLVLSARAGGTVVAPAQGEVVFTGPFMDYGRMVLLKHGNGYISLLAGLGTISVGLNQQVGAGEPLGSMGGGDPKLYIELRERSKPIDPANWFANLPSSLAKR